MAIDVRRFIPEEQVNTLNGRWIGRTDIYGTLRQVLVEPLSSDTTYDIGIRDEGNMVIYLQKGVSGVLVGNTERVVLFPGEKTIIIENATRDEPFKLKIIYQL